MNKHKIHPQEDRTARKRISNIHLEYARKPAAESSTVAASFGFVNGRLTEQKVHFQGWKTARRRRRSRSGQGCAGSLRSHLHFPWWNRGSEWPWIWICRPSTGQRRSHLLFLQPTWKKTKKTPQKNKKTGDREKKKKHHHAEDRIKVNVCMPWVCCFLPLPPLHTGLN